MSPEQEQVARLLREHGPVAPPGLRTRIEAEIARATERRSRRRPLLNRLAIGGAVASLLVVLAVAMQALFAGGGATVFDAHGLSARGPDAPPPSPRSGDRELLAANVGGVAFPNWEPEFGWRAIGERSDEFDGRRTRTVFYFHEGHTIGYTIVPGQPLDPPDYAERRIRNGVEVALLRDGHGHDIAIFERQGKTCVLSGHVERRSTLVELAAWAGNGQVRF
jgi:hypothetical protein